MSAGYQLYYFPGRGRAEMARWAFAVAKIDFEDVRLSVEEWAKEKASGRSPLGQMPFLITPEGKILGQSGAIMKYICKKGGLSPSDSFDEALADMIHDGVNDLRNDLAKGHFEKDEGKKKELMTKFFLTTLPERLSKFEDILKSREEGKSFFFGDKLTYADISFVAFVNGIKVSIDNQKAKGNPMPDIDELIVRKKEKYQNLINEMSRNYRCVSFVNLSMSSLGVFSDECSTFLDMMNDIGIDKKQPTLYNQENDKYSH